MSAEIIQTNIQLTNEEPVIVEQDGSVHQVTVYPLTRAKDIQGPEQNQISGQLKLSKDTAIERHVEQFWSERMSDLGDPKVRLEISISRIERARTIRGVRRAAMEAYADGAKGKPYQKLVQEVVVKRKDEIKSARGGQQPRQDMSW